LTRAAPLAGDRFGHSVAALGNLVAVGAPLANIGTVADPGQVSVFRFESSAWTPRAVINADAVVAGDKFGQSVAFGGTESSAVLAVGTPGDDAPSRTNCGSVFVHVLGPTGLVVSANRLISPVPLTSALLGMGVTVDGTGTRVAAGAPLADVTGIGTDCGAATVWTLASGSWSGVELAPVDRAAGENFGTSLAFRADGAALVIGSPLDFVSGIAGRGSAVVMVREGSAWSTYDRLVLPAVGTSAANLGRAVGFRGSEILVGGPKQAPGGTVRTFASPP
jgi:hypothetical protein